MSLRKQLVYGACWLMGGHDYSPSQWEADPSRDAWVREVRCQCCGKGLRRELVPARQGRPLDIWGGA